MLCRQLQAHDRFTFPLRIRTWVLPLLCNCSHACTISCRAGPNRLCNSQKLFNLWDAASFRPRGARYLASVIWKIKHPHVTTWIRQSRTFSRRAVPCDFCTHLIYLSAPFNSHLHQCLICLLHNKKLLKQVRIPQTHSHYCCN